MIQFDLDSDKQELLILSRQLDKLILKCLLEESN